MPRKSVEQRAAELWRTGNKPPEPPKDLALPAVDLWRRIAGSKPGDYWTPTLCVLLHRFVETAEYADRIAARVGELDVGDPEALALARQMTAANASLGSLAVRMRLSAQNEITPHSRARMSERRSPFNDDELLHPLIGTRQ
jgi:hypothetical protein